jgi:alkylation response protein AidB-like acyl-CoA dehydrogenase
VTDWNTLSNTEFREIARNFLIDHYPSTLRYPTRRLRWHEIKQWYLKLSSTGWLAPNWPAEYGGMGLNSEKLLTLILEQENWGVARTPDMGITMVGPLLIRHGSTEQKSKYLPKILSGEHIWCQGYSEPNSGSDLASLRTEAILSDDHFIVNGQKTWTTLAQDATHMFMLVRTDRSGKKQSGISFLLVDFKSPGITIRPIRNVAGEEEFCEVFFDNVKVPIENLVGEINSGWSLAKALLGFERIFFGSPKQAQYALKRLSDLAYSNGIDQDPSFKQKITQLKLDVEDLGSLYGTFVNKLNLGEPIGADVSILKIWATETTLRIANASIEAAGAAGSIRPENSENIAIDVLSAFYSARAATIYGGTSEIQRNIVARSVLSMPD